jgi:hypothetical protein
MAELASLTHLMCELERSACLSLSSAFTICSRTLTIGGGLLTGTMEA